MCEEAFINAEIGVFWNVVECPIPEGLNPDSVYRNIKSGLRLMGYRGDVSTTFWAYSKKISEELSDDYSAAGITMEHVRGHKWRVDIMTKDILFFALQNPNKPANMLVIADHMSRKPELVRVLQVLKSRNINVVVAQTGGRVPVELHGIVSSVCLSRRLLARGNATLLELDADQKNVMNPNFSLHDSELSDYSVGNTGVFWDTKDCPNPNALESDFYLIGKSIKSCLADMDKSGSMLSWISAYEDGGKVTVWNGGTETRMVSHQGDRLRRMSLDILLWAIDNRVGQYDRDRRPNVIVISRNIPKTRDFILPLKCLISRCNIIFGLPDEVKSHSWKTASVINFGAPFFSSGSSQRRGNTKRDKKPFLVR
ncbi:unnamed protein product [Microthlaspi erraticum]|uniref:NYN domain-containing protein n=1 Tax=Microthlaspi erraticum TaxID=1685480 RepID=A0A6D2KMW3_9BRAS|nr:unnamed protein product [Microthlaspi erraticum]